MAKSKDQAEAKVISLADRGRPFRKAPSPPEKRPAEATAESVEEYLRKIAPLSEDLLSKLEIPSRLYTADGSMFSSDPETSMGPLARSILLRLDLPELLPDYGIGILSQGSNTYCMLLDKRRKIIVFEPVANMYVKEGGSWADFASSLDEAIERSKASPPGKSGFIIAKDRLLSAV
ncbi:MAG: hypothetical protein U0R44_03420 [Candidatus Micrarchaeia archaeon]